MLFVISASLTILGCGGGSTDKGLSQNSNQNSPSVSATEVLSNDSFLITTSRQELIRVSPLTGASELLYTLPYDLKFALPPDVVDNHVIVGASDNTLNAINLSTGGVDWDIQLNDSVDARGMTSPVACANPVCYVISAPGTLFAINVRSKAVIWKTSLHTSSGAAGSLVGRPLLVQGNYIYAATNHDTGASAAVQILDRNTGARVHTIALQEFAIAVPVLEDNRLLVATETSLRAYSTDSFELIWQTSFDGTNGLYGTSNMAVARNTIVIVANDPRFNYDSEGQVFVGLNASTGKVLWTTNAGTTNSYFSPQTDGFSIFSMRSRICNLTCTSGSPIALNPQNGRALWAGFPADVDYIGRQVPLVAAGSLYFSDLNEIGGDRRGFMSIDQVTTEIDFHAPQINSLFTNTPILVNDGKVFRTIDFPTYIP